MIEDILPVAVMAAEAYADVPADPLDPATLLFPEEAAALARAVPSRQREYATVRTCARRAMGALGMPPAPLVTGARGAPVWPEGVVGSMTHCRGYRAAAVARTADAVTIGIDAEPATPTTEGFLASVSLPGERESVRELTDRRPEVPWSRILFSAKESVFKAWYPLTGRTLDFDQAHVDIDADASTFTAALRTPGPVVAGRTLSGFEGRWLCRGGLVVTAIVLTPDHHRP
ncbi:4'-phosphopantetheinyl transferase [Streptomyces xanthophaeus]|uniref:4'-phosphopantetheinyl transferase family protein n=1 Tax=Streptomyces xanthophaeus TaxID=67385 RepID=UPI003690F878